MIKLIQNETIKNLKKTSTKILIILSVLAIIAAMGFSKLIINLNNISEEIIGESDWKIYMQDEIKNMKSSVEMSRYDEETVADMKAMIDTYELAIKYDVNYNRYYGSYWKADILSEIERAKYNVYAGIEKEKNEKLVNDKIAILDKDDYSAYLEARKVLEKTKLDNKEITQEEYDDNIYIINLYQKHEINRYETETQDWKREVCYEIESIKRILRTGIDLSTGKLLTPDKIQETEDKLKIAEYRLEHNAPTQDSMSSGRSMYDAFAPEFSMMVVALLMVIIAGSSISTEISKGTIKFLLFTPNKRWKILLSKILSAILILAVLTVALSLISIVIGSIFFEEAGSVYVYISNGEVSALSNFTYTILYFLASSIDILVYMIFAFMLSTITRNTALTVGVSIACYIGSGMVMSILNYYITADWVKYIPFNNLGMADKIFANSVSYSTMEMASNVVSGVTVGFSIAVLAVCTVLMIVTMFDSFNKRDIV